MAQSEEGELEDGQADLILVCEACEHAGPSLLHLVDKGGDWEAGEFLDLQQPQVREEVVSLVVRVLSADTTYHAAQGEQDWAPPADCHTLLPHLQLAGRALAGYVCHFTLPDLAARGCSRTHCVLYLTEHAEKLTAYFPRMRRAVAAAALEWKLGAWGRFLARCQQLATAADSVAAEAAADPAAAAAAAAVADPAGGRAEPPTRVAWLQPAELAAVTAEGAALRRRAAAVRAAGEAAGVSDRLRRCAAAAAERHATALSGPQWAQALLESAARRPSPEKLPPLREVVGEGSWGQGMVRLVHLLQVLGRPPEELSLMEDDWSSAGATVDAGPEGSLPPSAAAFGELLAAGTDLAAHDPAACPPGPSSPVVDERRLLLSREVAAPTSVQPQADADAGALMQLAAMYPEAAAGVAWALLTGRPLLVVGPEGDAEGEGTVRWAVRGLRQLLPARAPSAGGSGVEPWVTQEVGVADLAALRLFGARSERALSAPCAPHVAVFDLISGATRRVPPYGGRWLHELLGPGKQWRSPAVFARFLRYWQLRLALAAAAAWQVALLQPHPPPAPQRYAHSDASSAGAAGPSPRSVPHVGLPAGSWWPGGGPLPQCSAADAMVVRYLCGVLRDACVGGATATRCDEAATAAAQMLTPGEADVAFPIVCIGRPAARDGG